MKFETIGAATLSHAMEGKHVAALPHYQAKHRETRPCLYNYGSAPQ